MMGDWGGGGRGGEYSNVPQHFSDCELSTLEPFGITHKPTKIIIRGARTSLLESVECKDGCTNGSVASTRLASYQSGSLPKKWGFFCL